MTVAALANQMMGNMPETALWGMLVIGMGVATIAMRRGRRTATVYA
ncbi:MAG TPA: hypothetical protein VL405_01730 [Sphingomonas sp.]|nr:hypothetical protein [Sphingomonas sp.]